MQKPENVDQRVWDAFKKILGDPRNDSPTIPALWAIWLDGYKIEYRNATGDHTC